MTIDAAKAFLLEFYEDYYEIDADEGRNFPDMNEKIKAEDEVLEDYAAKLTKGVSNGKD